MSEEDTIVQVNGKQYSMAELGDIRTVPCVFGGDDCLWFRPSSDYPVWTQENITFRSLIVRKEDGKIVSAGFKKFFNGDEKAHIDPLPKDLAELTFMEKIDGSLLIVSKHNGELITRTRNALTSQHTNSAEISDFQETYPKVFDNDFINSGNYSLLFEWTTPTNVIVINYGKQPELRLLNVVDHRDYSLLPLKKVTKIAEYLGVDAPKQVEITSFEELEERLKNPEFKEEGYCVYFNKDQLIRKLKGLWYLTTHRAKSDISFNRIFDIFIASGIPTREQFITELEKSFDHECMAEVLPFAEEVLALDVKTKKQLEHCKNFVASGKALPRADLYKECVVRFGGLFAGACMRILSNQQILPKEYKKLLNETRLEDR